MYSLYFGLGGILTAETLESKHKGIYHQNEIARDEAMRGAVEDSDGTVLCEYKDLNKSVTSFRYGHANGEMLPVTVYSMQEMYDVNQRIQVINSVFAAIYFVEAAAVIFFYLKKRAR